MKEAGQVQDGDPPLRDVIITRTLPATTSGGVFLPERQATTPAVAATVASPSGPWTVWMSDDDALDDLGGAGVFAQPGSQPQDEAYWLWTGQHRVGARDHDPACADIWHGGCDCGAEAALTPGIRASS